MGRVTAVVRGSRVRLAVPGMTVRYRRMQRGGSPAESWHGGSEKSTAAELGHSNDYGTPKYNF